MSVPAASPDSDLPPQSEPAAPPLPTRPGRRGGRILLGGKPGNRGGRGRTARRTIIRVSQDLDTELGRLKEMAASAHDVTCPKCAHTFTPKPTSRMDSRERIAYARLLADIKAGGKGEEEPPVSIVVATASPADVMASATGELAGVELVTGGPAQIEPGKPDLGPPERTQSGSSRE